MKRAFGMLILAASAASRIISASMRNRGPRLNKRFCGSFSSLSGEQVLARPFSARERSIVSESLLQMLAYYEQYPDAASQLISIGESKPDSSIDAPKFAAMTMVANQLMNLDEALNK